MAIKSKFQAGHEYRVAFKDARGDLRFGKQYSPRSRTLYYQPSFSGPMRKHGNWKHDRCALPGPVPKVEGARLTMLHRRNGLAVGLKHS